jgi:hypothetical protein
MRKEKFIAELGAKKWLLDLALLSDISCHVSDINTIHQGQNKFTSDILWEVRASEMKLKLFRKQTENVNLCHIYSCNLVFFIRMDQ